MTRINEWSHAMDDVNGWYEYCQRRDGQVFVIRVSGGMVTGAYGPLTVRDVDYLRDEDLPGLDYDANPAAAAWFNEHAYKQQWRYSLRAPFYIPVDARSPRWDTPMRTAHVLVAEEDAAIRKLLTTAIEQEGHHVTAPNTFWGVLAVLRSTLHPLVVFYDRDRCWYHLVGDEERLTALENARTDLQRHRYVILGWGWDRPPLWVPRLDSLERELQRDVLGQPLKLERLLAFVERAAS
jgi:hypothetical protein